MFRRRDPICFCEVQWKKGENWLTLRAPDDSLSHPRFSPDFAHIEANCIPIEWMFHASMQEHTLASTTSVVARELVYHG